jgi:hypothetical protein
MPRAVVVAVRVEEGALLLDDEHERPELQQGVELVERELGVGRAAPGERDRGGAW